MKVVMRDAEPDKAVRVYLEVLDGEVWLKAELPSGEDYYVASVESDGTLHLMAGLSDNEFFKADKQGYIKVVRD